MPKDLDIDLARAMRFPPRSTHTQYIGDFWAGSKIIMGARRLPPIIVGRVAAFLFRSPAPRNSPIYVC